MREMREYHDYLMEELSDSEESIAHIQIALEEYQDNGDSFVLLMALRSVVEAQGNSSEFIRRTPITPQNLLEDLSRDEIPNLDTLAAILCGLGCRLSVVNSEDAHLNKEAAETLNRVASKVRQPNYHLLRADKGSVISESLSQFPQEGD